MTHAIEIRPATPADFQAFYGRGPHVSVRALVALKDGVIKCIAGITLEQGISIAFSDSKLEDTNKYEIYRTAKKLADWMRQYHPTVIKWQGSKDTAKFLQRMGFKLIKQSEEASVYVLP